MEMEELLHDGRVRALLRHAMHRGLEPARLMLGNGTASGSALAFTVRFLRRTDGLVVDFVPDDLIQANNAPISEISLARILANQMRDLSTRTGMSTRLAIASGLRRDDETGLLGSAVTHCDEAGMWLLIVTCGGLSKMDNESTAELVAALIKDTLLRQAEKYADAPA